MMRIEDINGDSVWINTRKIEAVHRASYEQSVWVIETSGASIEVEGENSGDEWIDLVFDKETSLPEALKIISSEAELLKVKTSGLKFRETDKNNIVSVKIDRMV